jgi:polyhydroxyalkanoate synthase
MELLENGIDAWWELADAARRGQGALMDRLGLGPQTTPARTVGTWGTARLLAYQEPDPERAVLLIVPAPIKTGYIWDLSPEVSVVRRCQQAGLQTYLIEWQRPRSDDEALGLRDYAGSLVLSCLDAIAAETTQRRCYVAGHSLGGTLAAIFASLHPERVHGLIELEGPMAFSREAGQLEAAVATVPTAEAITQARNVAGSFMSMAGELADPITFGNEPLLDWLGSLPSPRARAIYLRVRRWTLDEMPMPRRLFEEVTDRLYRENRFADGKLTVSGRLADPRRLAMPILAIFDPRSRIVPPVAMTAYRDRSGSADVQLLEYSGDVGVMLQHVGVLVGNNAHRSLWSAIFKWIQERYP